MKNLTKNKHQIPEQIKEHYEIEKELASKLRSATTKERESLYSSLYDELYKRVPLHPQLTKKYTNAERERAVSKQMKFIRPFLEKNISFVEIGPGDCALSFEVSKFVKQVFAVDVSKVITENLTQPANFQLVISNGQSIPLPENSVDVVYSNQLMEHLHPDDACEQLKNIYNALKPRGIYVCITPNRLNGPHDVSKYFDKVATGFHLKEYTTFELANLFKKVGFSRFKVYLECSGVYFNAPLFLVCYFEKLLEILPHSLRNKIVKVLPFRLMLGSIFVGIK